MDDDMADDARARGVPVKMRWRRVENLEDGCPGLCDEFGYVYDCIDGCCVDPEGGCDLCGMRCDYCWERVLATPSEVS